MTANKTIFVTGGTGRQGGAVAKNALAKGWNVKVLTRNPVSNHAVYLKGLGAEIIKGDLNEPERYRASLENVDGIFSVQSFENGIKNEINQGKSLASLAKAYHTAHIVYSSVGGADLKTGIPHWESKYEIENHIRSIQLPYTIIRPVSFYENFLIPQVKQRIVKGQLSNPVNKDINQLFIGVEDIGRITVDIFSKPDQYLGQTFSIAAEHRDLSSVAVLFSSVLGRKITYEKLPSIITRMVMGKNLHAMFQWLNKNGNGFSNEVLKQKKDFPNMLTLEQWITIYFKNA